MGVSINLAHPLFFLIRCGTVPVRDIISQNMMVKSAAFSQIYKFTLYILFIISSRI